MPEERPKSPKKYKQLGKVRTILLALFNMI